MEDKIQYVSIERGEDFRTALTKMQIQLGPLSQYVVYDKLETLMGTFLILKLRRRTNINNIAAKVDGPGFIIQQIFNYLSENN